MSSCQDSARAAGRLHQHGLRRIAFIAVATWSDPGTNARGNLTTASHWLNTSNAYLSAHTQYDQYGSVRKTIDARGVQTNYVYDAEGLLVAEYEDSNSQPAGT